MSFADNLDKKVDMRKCKLDLMRPFITDKLNALMPLEDEVIIEYVFSQLEDTQFPNGKEVQMMLTGFLGKTKAKAFMQDLWNILLESQESPYGVPKELIEQKKNELERKKQEDKRLSESVTKNRDTIERNLNVSSNRNLDRRSTTTTTSGSSRWNEQDRRGANEIRQPIVVASSTVRPTPASASVVERRDPSPYHERRHHNRHRSSSRDRDEQRHKHKHNSSSSDDESDSSSSHRKSHHKSHKHKKKSKKHKRSDERSDRVSFFDSYCDFLIFKNEFSIFSILFSIEKIQSQRKASSSIGE